MTAEARIERLRKFCKGELAYADLCGDIACLLEELTVAKLAIGLSGAHEKALIEDAEKHRAENARLRAENVERESDAYRGNDDEKRHLRQIINNLRVLATTDHESKEAFISRVNATLNA